MLRSAISALMAAGLAAAAHADDTQLWTGITLEGKVPGSERWTWSANSEQRFTENVSDLTTTLIRASADYSLQNGVKFGGGIVRYYDGGLFTDRREDRLWQQMAFPMGEWQGGRFTARFRTEQRMNASGGETGWRVRQRFTFERPIEGTDVSWKVWNETYFALNGTDWGQDPGFDQNRLGLAFDWQATERVSFEAGYMNIGIDGEDELFSETRHTFMLSVTVGY